MYTHKYVYICVYVVDTNTYGLNWISIFYIIIFITAFTYVCE